MFARENFTRLWFLTRTYFNSRMMEGSLIAKVMECACCSYSSMTSTFPANRSISAFFQEMILSGSYEAFRSRVACIVTAIFKIGAALCQGLSAAKPLSLLGFIDLLQL